MTVRPGAGRAEAADDDLCGGGRRRLDPTLAPLEPARERLAYRTRMAGPESPANTARYVPGRATPAL